tara:strand:+ start:3676 stop:4602 length:927 start_codon:yes stop_codon:yes gene_type:complete
MTYIPKSKLNIKETNGQEFQLISNKKAYVGKYMQLSNGKIFAGSDPLNPGGELESINVVFNNLGYSRDVRIYKALKPEMSLYVGKIKDIPFSKNTPTEDNYSDGYFIRYFVKKTNQNNFYKEVSKEVYNSLKKKKSEYDINLYTPGQIKWALRGNVRNINRSLLSKSEKRFPNLSILYPQLDEFSRAGIVNNQFAKEGELFYKDNPDKGYIGPYHIHPVKGPMVGAIHRNVPHDKLIFAEDLVRNQVDEIQPILPKGFIPIKDTPYGTTESIPTTPMQSDVITSTPSTPTPSTPSYGGGSSGGGGGGY